MQPERPQGGTYPSFSRTYLLLWGQGRAGATTPTAQTAPSSLSGNEGWGWRVAAQGGDAVSLSLLFFR